MPVKSDWRAPWRRQCRRSCSARRGGPPARLEADRQPGRAEHVHALARLPRIGAGQPKALQAHEEIREGDPALQAGERRAQAEVEAVPERDMRVGLAGDVEAVSVAELLRVAVRGAEHRQYELPGRNQLAVHL